MSRCFDEGEEILHGFVDVDDLDFQIIADLAMSPGFLVVVIGHFIDVEQTGEAVFESSTITPFRILTTLASTISSAAWLVTAVSMDSEAVFVREGDSLFFHDRKV